MPPDSVVTPFIDVAVNISQALSLVVMVAKSVRFMGFSIYQWAWSWVAVYFAVALWRSFQRRLGRLLGDDVNSVVEQWEREVDDLDEAEREEFLNDLISQSKE